MQNSGGNGGASDRSAGATAVGCVWQFVFLQIELVVFIVIAALVAEQVAPGLRARGYNTNIGAGFLIAAGLGCVMAIYPTLWLHRWARRLWRRR